MWSAGQKEPSMTRSPRSTRLPVIPPALDRPAPPDTRAVLTELQALGARWATGDDAGLSRRGGAGPSDHTALVFDGQTVMVPIHTRAAERSPYVVRAGVTGAVLERDGELLGEVRFPSPPRFY